MVVNGGRIINLATSYNFDMITCAPMAMAGKAVLICQQNSHPFLDRTLNLEQPVKIGRSVARARAAQNNGIFDCKVLSRNHALFWYANGKFFLQDTKSSNGTFVNNQRLSKSGEESSPREVCSGDIVQFGVDVLENSRKVTHGCIVANLKLYLPDGKEAKASLSTAVLSCVGSVPVEDLYQLNQHIQEALQREQLLQTKLASLQQLVLSLQQASDLSWKALIAEDRLLSRVETLETQIQTYSKNFAEDKLREELRKLNEDKNTYQITAKECLKKILEEKLEAIQKCEDIKITLMNTEAECANFKELMEQSHEELKELAVKHSAEIVKTEELKEKLQATEDQMKEVISRLEADNEDLNKELQNLLCNEALLLEKISKLESSEEIEERQPICKLDLKPKTYLEKFTEIYDHPVEESDRDIYEERIVDENLDDPKYLSLRMDHLFVKLARSLHDHKETSETVDLIAAQLGLLQEEKCSKLQRINALEYELEVHSIQLRNYREQNRTLGERLDGLEQRLENEDMSSHALIELPNFKEQLELDEMSNGFNTSRTESLSTSRMESLQGQISELKELLTEAREKSELSEQKVNVLQVDLDTAKDSLSETTENLTCATEKLEDAQKMREERETAVVLLKQQMKSLETSLLEKTLQEKLELQHNSINKHEEETLLLRKQLLEAQQASKQYKNELEQVKERLRILTEEQQEKSNDETSNWDNRTVEDFETVKQECTTLRETIKTLNSQILKLDNEKKLQTELIEERQRDMEEELDGGASTSDSAGSMTSSTLPVSEEIDTSNLKILELEEELVLVKERYMSCNEEKTRLEKEFSLLRQDYQGVSNQSSFYNCVFLLPLLILFIALTMAFYPTLSFLFGTTDRA